MDEKICKMHFVDYWKDQSGEHLKGQGALVGKMLMTERRKYIKIDGLYYDINLLYFELMNYDRIELIYQETTNEIK